MNPALSQEFHIFCEQEQLQKHATLDKNPYCVYGILINDFPSPQCNLYVLIPSHRLYEAAIEMSRYQRKEGGTKR